MSLAHYGFREPPRHELVERIQVFQPPVLSCPTSHRYLPRSNCKAAFERLYQGNAERGFQAGGGEGTDG
jgi:hypothetical protein